MASTFIQASLGTTRRTTSQKGCSTFPLLTKKTWSRVRTYRTTAAAIAASSTFSKLPPRPSVFRSFSSTRLTQTGSAAAAVEKPAPATSSSPPPLPPLTSEAAPLAQSPHSEAEPGVQKTQRKDAKGNDGETDTDFAEAEDLPLFTTLKPAIAPELMRALTKGPFNFVRMSPVQAAVLPLLPKLAEPYSESASTTDDSYEDGGVPRDLLVKAKTGTGKTLAFLLPAVQARLNMLHQQAMEAIRDSGLVKGDVLDSMFSSTASPGSKPDILSNPKVRRLYLRAQDAYAQKNLGTLVISPTRELATQIAEEAQRLTRHLDGFEVRLFVGGAERRGQLGPWRRGRKDLLVATPGRLRDYLENERDFPDAFENLQLLVLDEADMLLDMGFRPDIDEIKSHLPSTPQRQNFLFSATISRAIQQIAKSTLSPNHKFINCVKTGENDSESSPVHAHVPQYVSVLETPMQQLTHVVKLLVHDQLVNPGRSKTIIFLPTTKMTQLFADALRDLSRFGRRSSSSSSEDAEAKGYPSVFPAGRNMMIYEIHSKKAMSSRTNTSASFRQDKSGASVLVTSDVSARGVDYPNVSRVIQVGIPANSEQYVHRVGRTGRAGADKHVQSRGDLVLLDFEKRFVEEQLSSVPLQVMGMAQGRAGRRGRPKQEEVGSAEDIVGKELEALVEEFDKDRKAFLKARGYDSETAAIPSKLGRSRAEGRQSSLWSSSSFSKSRPLFNPTAMYQPMLQELPQMASDYAQLRVDPESVRETFLSLLGFYVSKTSEMRVSSEAVFEGLKAWATEGWGMEKPPFIPQVIMKALTTQKDREGRGSSYGRRGRERSLDGRRTDMGKDGYGRRHYGNEWEKRGRQNARRDDDQRRGGRERDSWRDDDQRRGGRERDSWRDDDHRRGGRERDSRRDDDQRRGGWERDRKRGDWH